MALKRMTSVERNVIIHDIALLQRCGMEFGVTEERHGERNWLECLSKIGSILGVRESVSE
jgi:hypothetical protein